jgi:hypothetical protein
VPKLWLYRWGLKVQYWSQKIPYDYVPASNVAKKKVLLVLEIAWSVGCELLANKTLKVLRWGSCGSAAALNCLELEDAKGCLNG